MYCNENNELIPDEHAVYEYSMLKGCYKLLSEGINDAFTFNVLHESFCIHAYNLIGYLRTPKLIPIHPLDDLEDKINNQVLTLTENRTSNFDEKLQNADREYLYNWIVDGWNKAVYRKEK